MLIIFLLLKYNNPGTKTCKYHKKRREAIPFTLIDAKLANAYFDKCPNSKIGEDKNKNT